MGEGLREVPELAPGAGIELLGVEVERAAQVEEPLAQLASGFVLADLCERRDQPEGADRERSLDSMEAVLGAVDPVTEDEPVLGQLLVNRVDRVPEDLVLAG